MKIPQVNALKTMIPEDLVSRELRLSPQFAAAGQHGSCGRDQLCIAPSVALNADATAAPQQQAAAPQATEPCSSQPPAFRLTRCCSTRTIRLTRTAARRSPPPSMANSPRLDSLVRDGKLYLSLRDAIDLALENNLDLVIARYQPAYRADGYSAHQGRRPGARRQHRRSLRNARRRSRRRRRRQRRRRHQQPARAARAPALPALCIPPSALAPHVSSYDPLHHRRRPTTITPRSLLTNNLSTAYPCITRTRTWQMSATYSRFRPGPTSRPTGTTTARPRTARTTHLNPQLYSKCAVHLRASSCWLASDSDRTCAFCDCQDQPEDL